MGNYPIQVKPIPQPLTEIEQLTNEIEGEREKLRKIRIKIEALDERYYEIDDKMNRDTFVDQLYPGISDEEKIKQYKRSHRREIKALQDQYNMLLEEKEEIVKRISLLDKKLSEKKRQELYK